MSTPEMMFDSFQLSEGMEIRRATPADCADITALEASCFPPAEAASYESFAARLAAFPDRFYLLILPSGEMAKAGL